MGEAATRRADERHRRTAPPEVLPARSHAAGVAPSADTSPVTARMGRRRLVVLVAITLFVFGVVMVASASSGEELLAGRDQWALFRKQVIFGGVGLIGMWLAMRAPLELVRRVSRPLVWICVALVLVTMVPGLGHEANGATRWINLGFFQLQPSEPLKLAVLAMLADHLSRTRPPEHWMRDLVKSPGGIALGVAGGVVALQSDLGSGLVIGATTMILYMLAGTRWSVLWRTIGPAVALVALSILTEQFRRDRFLAFLDPWHSAQGNGYQLVQALIAIGSGGPFGVGLGHSVQKIQFLPEAHTDMIFAVIVEELGIVGVALVLGSFGVLAIVGTRIAMRARTRFSALLAAGLTAMVVGQAAVNVAGVTGVMPLTGVPLPLVSYGGSSLIITLASLGLLANIATERRPSRSFAMPPLHAEPLPPPQDDDAHADDSSDSLDEYDFDDDFDPEHDRPDDTTADSAGRGRRHRRASRAGARGR